MMVKCIVCYQELPIGDVASRIETEEEHYFFCSAHCRELFDEEPGLYIPGLEGEQQDDGQL